MEKFGGRFCKEHRTRIFVSLLLAFLFFFVISWLYKAYVFFFLCLVWRKPIRARWGRWACRGLLCFALLVVFCVMPRYRIGSSDKVRLVYYDEKGGAVHPPLFHYIGNLVLTEEETCHLACLVAKYVAGPLGAIPQWYGEIKSMNSMSEFYDAYKYLNRGGSFVVSGVTPQVMHQFGLQRHSRSVYVIRPDDYRADETYPLVVFAHGALGNWKLYQGILSGLRNCVVLSIGSADLSGVFTKEDIGRVFSTHLTLLENLGYKIDKRKIHIIGLSNGETAARISYNDFATRFRSITFLSCSPNRCHWIPGKVLMVGGGKDVGAVGQPRMYRKMKRNGVNCRRLWFADEGHFVFATRRGEVTDFLNHELGLVDD